MELTSLLARDPSLSYDFINEYVDLGRLLKQRIALNQPSYILAPPLHLPSTIHGFFRDVLGTSDYTVALCWSHLRHFVWSMDGIDVHNLSKKHYEKFLVFGLRFHIGKSFLSVPFC
jgi:hypothetical protein